MSASEKNVDTLRRAADAIRSEWGEPRGSAWSQVVAVHLALADWLDGEALVIDGIEPFAELINATYGLGSGGEAFIRFGRTESGEIAMNADTTGLALAVARAYLWEAAT